MFWNIGFVTRFLPFSHNRVNGFYRLKWMSKSTNTYVCSRFGTFLDLLYGFYRVSKNMYNFFTFYNEKFTDLKNQRGAFPRSLVLLMRSPDQKISKICDLGLGFDKKWPAPRCPAPWAWPPDGRFKRYFTQLPYVKSQKHVCLRMFWHKCLPLWRFLPFKMYTTGMAPGDFLRVFWYFWICYTAFTV